MRRAPRRKGRKNRGTNKGPIKNITRFDPANTFGFPDKLVVRLRYYDTASITSTTGGVGSYKFRANSCYDPNQTGVGHQPMYYDTYTSIYDHYSVVSCKAIVRFTNTVNTPFLVGVVIDDDSAASTSVNGIVEQSHSQSRYLTPLTGSNSSTTITVPWNCKDVLGIDPYASETYKTATGADPAEQSYIIPYAATTDGSTNTILFDITMEMVVLFTELATPTIS